MSRWIDADAVENTLQQIETITAMANIELGEEDDDIGEISMPIFTVRNIINTAPSIDIEPKRGEWIKRTRNTLIAQVNFAYCSECGQPIMHEHTRSLWNFCPNCGADMREREGE